MMNKPIDAVTRLRDSLPPEFSAQYSAIKSEAKRS